MAEDTPGPAPETPENEDTDPIAVALLGRMMGRGGNSKPDTAEGVGMLLDKTVDFMDDRMKSSVGSVVGPEDVALPVIMKPGGGYDFIPVSKFEEYSDAPIFRRGTATLTALDSFIAHVNRFGDDDSAVFACEDRSSPSVTAVLDYHRKDTLASGGEDEASKKINLHGDYRHGRHRSKFAFPLSDEWKAWHQSNGVKMGMADFSVFLEDNVLDVAEIDVVPDSAKRFVEMNGGANNIADWSKLTTLAKSLSIFESGIVTEAVNLASGEGQLTIGNSHDTEIAGVKATVPSMFFIAIPIFREGAIYRLPVRLRYRKAGAGVVFWYELWRSDRAFTDAFHEAIARIAAETEAQVFYGSAEA